MKPLNEWSQVACTRLVLMLMVISALIMMYVLSKI
jgi:hypothetical protein